MAKRTKSRGKTSKAGPEVTANIPDDKTQSHEMITNFRELARQPYDHTE